MPIRSRRFISIGALLSLALALSLPAHAGTYSKASLNGSYNFLFNNRTADPNAVEVVTLGVLTFNGKGGFSGSYTSMRIQELTSGKLGGNYTVAANGTGTLTFTRGLFFKFATVLSTNGAGIVNGVQMLQINDQSNEIVIGSVLLLSTTAQTYSVASLNGIFSFQYKVFTPDQDVTQTASIGLASFDGKGNCTFTSSTVTDGRYTTSTESDTYTVATNGIGAISNGTVFALGGASGGQASGLQFILPSTALPGNFALIGGATLQ